MENLKNKIEKGISTVIRQYELEGDIWNGMYHNNIHPYIPKLKKIREQLFSNDEEIMKQGLRGLENLLLSYRAWEDGYSSYFSDKDDTYKDKFVDNFNNWDEWYNFMESIVEDAKEYYNRG